MTVKRIGNYDGLVVDAAPLAPLRVATKTLTNAQIKGLPTPATAIEIVPAPTSGCRIVPLSVSFLTDTVAGLYGSINASYADLHFDYHGGGAYLVYGLIDDSSTTPPLTVVTQVLGTAALSVTCPG